MESEAPAGEFLTFLPRISPPVEETQLRLIMSHPIIIQGGMGVAVSGWTLARTVSCLGQLGVVSGTALAVVLARRLQLGDPGGAMRHALEKFPIPGVGARILEAYFIPGGKPAGAPFKLIAMPTLQPGAALVELTVAGNFAEVFLAKEGHHGVVGINFLEKIQMGSAATRIHQIGLARD